jgi:hypothetical protein
MNNSSLLTADRATHLKVVVLSLCLCDRGRHRRHREPDRREQAGTDRGHCRCARKTGERRCRRRSRNPLKFWPDAGASVGCAPSPPTYSLYWDSGGAGLRGGNAASTLIPTSRISAIG